MRPWKSKLRRFRELRAWQRSEVSLSASRVEEVCEGSFRSRSRNKREREEEEEGEISCRGNVEPLKRKRSGSEKSTSASDTAASASVDVDPLPAASSSALTGAEPLECLALAVQARPSRRKPEPPKVPPPPPPPSSDEPVPPVPKTKLEPSIEIPRILLAESPEEVLALGPRYTEEEMLQAWKGLVLLLHPDKLHGFDDDAQRRGAEALHSVHAAKASLRARLQELKGQVPLAPRWSAAPRLLNGSRGARKYELSWTLPEMQDPERPVEKYEIWAPRYCSDYGECYDWTMLASLPVLQSQFVIVEEAPTQQDCMWSADRVLRPTLPIAVHASNGKGASEALTVELPWADAFPWLRRTPSALCVCLRVVPCPSRWARCDGCGSNVSSASTLVLRCPHCCGEMLWSPTGKSLTCSSCPRRLGSELQQFRPQIKRGGEMYNSRTTTRQDWDHKSWDSNKHW